MALWDLALALWPLILVVAVAVVFIRLGRAPKNHDVDSGGSYPGSGPSDGGD